jgi:hypothetical protein
MTDQNTTDPVVRVAVEADVRRRSWVGELEHAISMARSANHDRNPNRQAEVDGWLAWGLDVAIARRGHSPIPPRPVRRFL